MGMTLCTSATVSRTEHSDLLALVWQHPSVGTAGHVCLWTALCQSPESGMTIRGTLGTAVTGWGFWALAELSLSSSVDPIVLLLLLSCFSRVQLCATPQTAAHQGPPSLGFSRQEHWSGLPLPSPRHESEKWKWSRPVVSDSLRPHGLQPTRLLCPWDFPGKSTGVGCHCLLRNICATHFKY